jgi:formylglycine-generating enzyme required for sulfatase activity
MCTNEGVVLRAQSGPATARIVSPGVAVSPYSASGSTQQIPWDQWKPGGEFTCAETGRRVILPLNLPPRESAPPPAASHGHPPGAGAPPLRVQRMQDRLLPAEPPRQPLPGNSQSPTVWSEDPPPPVAPPEPAIKRVESAPHKPRTQTPAPSPAPAPAAPQMSALQALAKRLPIPLLPAAAIAAVVLLGLIGLIWHFASPKPPVLVVQATPAPAPVVVAPPVEPPAKVQRASTASVAKTSPFQKGEKWENSLGMKLAPLSGTENSMATWPTRARDFQAFTEASGYEVEGGMLSYSASGWTDQGANWKTPGFFQSPVHPVVGVSADDAKAFCRWLTQKERDANLIDDSQAYRLPTDEEWSQIVGSGPYLWGSAWPPPGGAGNFASEEAAARLAAGEVISGYHDGFSTTSPVGSFSANALGLYDLAGNVCQWCLTPYTPDLNSAEVRAKNPHENDFPNATSLLVLRGSSCFDGDPVVLRSDYRRGAPPSLRAAYAGFRVVLGPLMQEPPPQIARASDNASKPSDAPADKDIPRAEPVKPADAAPNATATTVDPEVVGVWTTKGPKGKIEKLEVKADGTYTYSGPNPGSGNLSTDSGQLKQNSTSGGDAVSSGYDIKGNTLTLNGPNGPIEWRRTGGGTSGESGGEARRHSGTTQRVGPKPGGVIDHLEKVFKIFH